MRVSIAQALCDAILEQARREAPHECCGLLIGDLESVQEVHPARNELASATRYRIDPRDHFAAIRMARAKGLAVVGAYHSHPRSAPVPSVTDAREAWPDFLYLITSPAAPGQVIRGWRLIEGNFIEVPLVIGAEGGRNTRCVHEPSPLP